MNSDLPFHVFRDRLWDAMHSAKRRQSKAALLTLDINKFHELNHAWGHDKGDLALIVVATRIREVLGGHESFYHRLGDQFSIVLDEPDGAAAQQVAHRIIAALCQPIVVGTARCFISVSIGIALCPDSDENIDGLIRKAEAAMLRSKAGTPNTSCLYSATMDEVEIEPLTLKTELRHALPRGELLLQYQPQVDLRTEQVIGVEALVRWNHPALGILAPGKFITIAEETGLIIPIGEWVLTTACLQNKAWQAAGLRPIKTAVNFSAKQLELTDIVDRVQGILTKTGVEPSTVELEITEASLISNIGRCKTVMKELRALGVKLSIDDFGTGYSSLSYLSELPFDILKLDAAFVRPLQQAGSSLPCFVVAHAIVDLAHALNMTVVAEAVETQEQLACLRRMDCDQMQGYLYSRPVGPDEIARLLRPMVSERFA
ncbi:putative bifunctional diguanylate cyclase/phosphodiesterase [Variovorax saccharolyticus]|uniref:putative bifunctional diguanylate cyclase/phosphodiesterase n=1 Tax=Variovorax saccharolyticus TaxID=3053516 RepID=UPI002575876E|nr:bifunctional diguanylate cyclase/phosphodiesterase [Variovorax sp. J31P216]MDM0030184.1 bifunctional diguanylate cyclase/phosphodiesterase [Variovorax sp. J31P216]